MKNLLNTLVVLFLALTYTMAELVPNCSHVLHFSDEEVEYLQKLLLLKPQDHYEEIIGSLVEPNVLKKHPPYHFKQSQYGFEFYEIQNKEAILKYISDFYFVLENGTAFSRLFLYFIYIVLLITYEKLEIPSYNSTNLEYYYTITHGLYKALHRLPKNLAPCKKTFSVFQKILSNDKDWEVAYNSIFIPTNNASIYPQKYKNCSIQ